MTADEIIEKLGLQPHPEGGWYKETWRGGSVAGRSVGTAIYFLLKAGERSHWHRVDAAEIWHFHAGAPLLLRIAETANGPSIRHMLCADLRAGAPQVRVPKGFWQAAETTGNFTLVGCTVSPGFNFDGFELASPDFDIPEERDRSLS